MSVRVSLARILAEDADFSMHQPVESEHIDLIENRRANKMRCPENANYVSRVLTC